MGIDIDFGSPFLPLQPYKVTSGWGRPRPGGREHAGLDFSVPVGTPVLALADGEVIRAQHTASGDAGIWVAVKHAKGWVSRYMHFSRTAVKLGDRVRKGQIVGYSGNTGLSSGPHLHLDLKIDPARLPEVAFEVGTPKGGFHKDLPPYGAGVPGEPWVPIPMDRFLARVLDDAAVSGVPFWARRPRSLEDSGAFWIGLGVGVGATLLLFKRNVLRPFAV